MDMDQLIESLLLFASVAAIVGFAIDLAPSIDF